VSNPASRPVWLALGGLVALAAAIGIGRFVYTPILPLMADDLGWTKGTAGLLASANYLGYLLGALLVTTSALRGSRRTWLLLALAASAVTTASMGVVTSNAAFLALRLVGGVASAFVLVLASALVLDRLAAVGRSELSAIHFAGVGTGIVVSAAIVSMATALGHGWRSLWLSSGVASMLAVAIVARLMPDPPDEAARPAEGGRGLARRLSALVVAYGLFGFGYIITATFLVAIVRGSREAQLLEQLVWPVVGLTAVASVPVWTRIARRVGIGRAFAAASALEAVGVAASALWVTPPGVLLAAALLGGTFMGLTALGLIAARRLAVGDPRRALALMTAAFGLGQIVGPVFAGMLFDATGTFVLASLVAAIALLIAAGLVIGVPDDRRARTLAS
jgi:predicted MFS family arabinose efflux permease